MIWVRITVSLLAAGALAGLAACSTPEKDARPAVDQYSDDAALTARVKSAIATDVGARAAGAVSVETYRGTVQLSGTPRRCGASWRRARSSTSSAR